MNHRDAEDAEEVLKKEVSALGTPRVTRIDRQSNKGLVENDRCPQRALCLKRFKLPNQLLYIYLSFGCPVAELRPDP